MPLNLIFIQPGNYTIDDNGIPGDNISVIRDGNGNVIFTFGHPADALGFTVSVPGVHITVNFTDSMNAANFTIGSTDPDPMVGPPQSPDSIVMQNIVTTGTVTLVSNTTIIEGSDADAAADITAGALVMSAVTGIGTPANAIETRTGLFEAETTTGGVNISNFGSVQIGGVTANVDGLDVATSGDITFITVGSIFLTEPNSVTAGEVVHGGSTSGNVILTALGANSDIIGNVNNGAVTVPRGSLTMTAGRDIQLGTIGSDFNNDIITNNSLTLIAGRDILIDGFADILSDNFGLDTGDDLVFTAGRNIGILNLAGVSASASASGSGGGDAIITTGPGGTLTVNGPGSFALGSTSGDVIIRADRILIDAGSGISAPGQVIDIQSRTDGRAIILGSATDAALAVELSGVEMTRLFAPTLTIGSDTGGQIRLIGPVNMTAVGNAPDLILRSGTNVLIASNLTVLDELTIASRDDAFQSAASTITANSIVVLVDTPNDDSVVGGIATFNGTFTAASSTITGSGDGDRLTGNLSNNVLFGLDGSDILRGGGGSDTLIGGAGLDSFFGGTGDDVFFVDAASETVSEAIGEGNDRVVTPVSYALASGASVETLETIDFGATTAINLSGNELGQTITGNNGNNVLTGNGGNDNMVGLGGNDTFIANAAGSSTMNGNLGDDVFFVANGLEIVFELAGEGNDRVAASASWVLTAGSSVETLETVSLAATTAINLTGNALNQTITGNNGNNVLSGGGGIDVISGVGGNDTLIGSGTPGTLIGGTGDDVYFVSNASDTIIEASGEGNDRIASTVSFALAAAAEVETLEAAVLSATTALNFNGNVFQNTIIGNNGNNVLDGGGGSDVLNGAGGNDTLIGGGSTDMMMGAAGDDVFFVESAGDVASEGVGEGNDRVVTFVSYTLTAGSSIETLETISLADTAALNLTGNALNQTITGNNGNNLLTGGGGNDLLQGAGGNDTYIGNTSSSTMNGGTGNDVFFVNDSADAILEASGEGADRIASSVSYTLLAGSEVETLEAAVLSSTTALNFTGNAFQNTITGNNGVNTLDGKGGNDVLNGAGGVDSFAFTSALGAGNVDTILGFVSGTDRIALEDSIFTAIAPGALTAGAFATGSAAGDADDRIIYNPATGALLYDPDGTGAAAAVQFATLSGGPALAGSDFILI